MSTKGICPICGKEVHISDQRDMRMGVPVYCSRVCESNSRYVGNRYRDAGAMNKPTVQEVIERK